MLHPFAPFISETIYLQLPGHLDALYMERYPAMLVLGENDATLTLLQAMITDVRAYKVNHGLAPNAALKLAISTSTSTLSATIKPYLERFSFSQVTDFNDQLPLTPTMTSYLYPLGRMVIEELIDPVKMKAQLVEQLAMLESEIKRATMMLANPRFLEKAPPQKVKEEQDKLALYQKQFTDTKAKLASLG
jgi:valyl-tRNA synthetase